MVTYILNFIITIALFKFVLDFSKKRKEKREIELKTLSELEIEEKINKIKKFRYSFSGDNKLFELIKTRLSYELFLKKNIDLYNFKENNFLEKIKLEEYLYNNYFITLKEFDMLTQNYREELNFFSSTHKLLIEREKMEEAKFYIKENFPLYMTDYKAILLKQRELLFESVERKISIFPDDRELLELKEEYITPEELLIEYIERKEKLKFVVSQKKETDLEEKREFLEIKESFFESQRQEEERIILEEEKNNKKIFSENLRRKGISLFFNNELINVREESWLENQRRKKENNIWKEKLILAEQKRLEEERKLAEQRRLEEERKLAEQRRLEEERKLAEQRKLEEERKLAEQRRLEEERKLAEQRRLEEKRKEKKRRLEERKLIKQKTLEEARILENDYEKTTNKFSIYNENIFGYGNKNGIPYFYFTKYYPLRYGRDLNQDFVYEFKSGYNPEYYANIFSKLINKLFENNYDVDTEDVMIIPVVASTIQKNEIRYKKLFELISKKTGVINGYDVIEVINDREAKHISNEYTSVDSHIKIHFEKLNFPRRIILIDDVITRGRTIKELADKFIDRESDSFVVGMVLAETYSDWIESCAFYEDEDKPRKGMNKIDILDFEEVAMSSLKK